MRVMKQQMISEVPAEGLRVEAEGRGRPRRRRREVLQGAPRRVQPEGRGARQRDPGQGQGQGRQGLRRGARRCPRRPPTPTGPEGVPRPGRRSTRRTRTSKQRGGDLSSSTRTRPRYPKPIVEAAFKLAEVGDVAPPDQDRQGLGRHPAHAEAPGLQPPAGRGQAPDPAAPVPRHAHEGAWTPSSPT